MGRTLAEKVKQLRDQQKISAYRLADLSGLTRGYISRIESGKVTNITLKTAQKLGKGFGVDPGYFLEESITEPTPAISTANSQALADLSNIKETITEIEERLRSSRPQTVRLPDYGPAPAGAPLDISQAPPGYMDIPIEYANGIAANKLFIVHASGESLVEDDIHDGDILIVERNPELIEGKIYVVNIPGNGITVKHLYRTTDNKARLVPANHNIPEMVFEEVKVEGRVLASFRPPIKH